MSFRDNLQYLRSTHNMTQEQLAMLLGVSRQSVTKWEAEKSYPEMDKLLRMCSLFDCKLDDLIQGDLSELRELRAEPAAALPIDTPVQDVVGYDEHMRRFALRSATGAAAIIAFLGLSSLFEGVSPIGDPDSLQIGVFFVGVLIGVALIVPAVLEHASFLREHPFVQDFYTTEEKAQARSLFARLTVLGVALVVIGFVVASFTDGTSRESLGTFGLMIFVAGAVWCFIVGVLGANRVKVEEYNNEAFQGMSEAQLAEQIDDPAELQRLVTKLRRSKRMNSLYGIVMLIATIVALCLLFVPFAFGVSPQDRAPVTEFFWIPWMIGGLICAVIAVWHEGRADESAS